MSRYGYKSPHKINRELGQQFRDPESELQRHRLAELVQKSREQNRFKDGPVFRRDLVKVKPLRTRFGEFTIGFLGAGIIHYYVFEPMIYFLKPFFVTKKQITFEEPEAHLSKAISVEYKSGVSIYTPKN